MSADCHIHMVLDGHDWRRAIRAHAEKPDLGIIRQQLGCYQSLGYTYLRDGGDKWGVGAAARQIAAEYGITYRTPLSPLHAAGHYGSFIGTAFRDLQEYTALVRQQKARGCDFIKVMISGLMDFDRYGELTEDGLAPAMIQEMIRIAHGEGFAVMAHCNGAETALAAAEAGADSIEHGAYLNEEALAAMAHAGTVWVPTLSAIGNLRGTGRFSEDDVAKILTSAMSNVVSFARMGGLIAPGSDAGAWSVPHAGRCEYALLAECLGQDTDSVLQRGIAAIQQKF